MFQITLNHGILINQLLVMISNISNRIRYFTFETITNSDTVHAVFGRSGGVSPYPYASLNVSTGTGDTKSNVNTNISHACNALNISHTTLKTAHQVHAARTITVDSRYIQGLTKADGLITQTKDISLFMKFADCVPLMIYDPHTHTIGLGHAGWKGTLAGVASSVIEAMQVQFGCKPHNLLAAIGPCITADYYVVSDDVANLFLEAYAGIDDIVSYRNDAIHLDLIKANIHSLTMSGVQSIENSGLCTVHNNADFYSHRVEGKRTGRFGALISLK